MNEKKISIPLLIGGLVLVVTITAGGIFLSLKGSNQSSSIQSSSSSSFVSSDNSFIPISSSISSINSYKDGTYTATGGYSAPSGDESVDVTLTISNGTISSVDVKGDSSNPTAMRYQTRFSTGISKVVIGKTIDQAYVSGNINGSSLTGDGFDAALDKIKLQAVNK